MPCNIKVTVQKNSLFSLSCGAGLLPRLRAMRTLNAGLRPRHKTEKAASASEQSPKCIAFIQYRRHFFILQGGWWHFLVRGTLSYNVSKRGHGRQTIDSWRRLGGAIACMVSLVLCPDFILHCRKGARRQIRGGIGSAIVCLVSCVQCQDFKPSFAKGCKTIGASQITQRQNPKIFKSRPKSPNCH